MSEKNTKKEVKEKEVKKEYANFWQRFCAFIIDVFLVSMVTSLITQPFANSENLQKLSDEAYDVVDQYTQKKIDANTYINRTADISYDIARQNGLSSIIGIAISILYFVVYQCKMNGQTLGKKLMKIKVVRVDNKNIAMNDFLFRSLLINSIFLDIVVLCFSLFASKDAYFYGTGIFEFIQYIAIFASSMMILSRKDKRGLQDLLGHTEVVKM